MSKVALVLQEHLAGEVTTNPDALKYFSCDASVLKMSPKFIVYPATEDDVRKVARLSWQLAEKNHRLAITARGGGTSSAGGALGDGITLVFTGHMDRILSLNPRKAEVVVEPGLNLDKLQQALYTHGLFLPAGLSGAKTATVGGSLSRNTSGSWSIKYGPLGRTVGRLQVVLANGEAIDVGPLSSKELSHKLGQSNFEGSVYRELDSLLEENEELLTEAKSKMAELKINTAGYNLWDVRAGGNFNLVPLLVGAEGTLGILTSATLKLQSHNPETSVAIVSLGRLVGLQKLLDGIRELEPASCEAVSGAIVQRASAISPGYLEDVLDKPKAAIHLLLEFDDKRAGKSLDKLRALAKELDADYQVGTNAEDRARLQRLHQAVNLLSLPPKPKGRLVYVADAVVPPARAAELYETAIAAGKAAGMTVYVSGALADGVVEVRAEMDLTQLGDRQAFFKTSETIYKSAVRLGGTTATSGDGRLRTPYIEAVYGEKLYELMREVKKIFDPHGILNPGVKFGSTDQTIKMLLNGAGGLRRYD